MSKQDRDRGGNRPAAKSEHDLAAKAVLDNMARLKALRLAREAAEPPRPETVKKKRAVKPKRPGEKAPALSDWLTSQKGGGHRT
jgi:hypothetical protein